MHIKCNYAFVLIFALKYIVFTPNTIDPARIKEVLEKDADDDSRPVVVKPTVITNKLRSPKISEEEEEEPVIHRSSTTPIRKQQQQQVLQKTPPSRPNSTDSSTFSVVEDDKILIAATLAENNELKSKVQALTEDTSAAKEIQAKQEQELAELRETIKNVSDQEITV